MRCKNVKLFDKVMRVFLVIGFFMLAGRIVTGIFRFFNWPFPTFFTDYHVQSLIILLIGIIGMEGSNYKKRRKKRI